MKKALITLLLLQCTIFAKAQYVSLGPIGSFGYSSITNFKNLAMVEGGRYTGKFFPSFSAGMGVIYAKHEHWGFGGALDYSREGAKGNSMSDFINFDQTASLDYINIPLRAYYFFGKYKNKIRPKIFAGPTVSILAGNSFDMKPNNVLTMDQINLKNYGTPKASGMDVGLHAGIGLNANISKLIWLNAEIAYYQGLMDVYKDANAAQLNQNLRVGIGLFFKVGK